MQAHLDSSISQVQSNWRKRYKDTCTSGFSVEACCAQVETCIQIALNCLEEDKQKRPDIVEIIDKLNQIETDAKEVYNIITYRYVKSSFLEAYNDIFLSY